MYSNGNCDVGRREMERNSFANMEVSTSMFYTNIDGVCSKVLELDEEITNGSPDMVAISGTELNKVVKRISVFPGGAYALEK